MYGVWQCHRCGGVRVSPAPQYLSGRQQPSCPAHPAEEMAYQRDLTHEEFITGRLLLPAGRNYTLVAQEVGGRVVARPMEEAPSAAPPSGRGNRLLEVLRSAEWVSGRDLLAVAGRRFGARLKELRDQGYEILSRPAGRGEYEYRLVRG